jgi:antitoxin VapB
VDTPAQEHNCTFPIYRRSRAAEYAANLATFSSGGSVRIISVGRLRMIGRERPRRRTPPALRCPHTSLSRKRGALGRGRRPRARPAGAEKTSVLSPLMRIYFSENIESDSPMALSLKDPETDRLARQVARLTGESLTQAVRKALSERLERERLRRGQSDRRLVEELNEIARHCAALPDLDTRSPDEIIGYDENGLWR